MTAAAILPAVQTKKCCGCKEHKPFPDFNKSKAGTLGLANICRVCTAAYKVKYKEKYPDKLRDSNRRRYEANKEKIRAQVAAYRLANPEAVSAAKKACYEKKKAAYIARIREYAATERGRMLRLAAQSKATKRRMAEDPVFAMKRRVYSCISSAISGKNYTKSSRTHEILGCSWVEFKAHIEKQFLKGMTWERRSEWHLDHIVPLSTAKTAEEVIALNHFTNFRPLWAQDNMLKSDRITHLI